MDMIIAQVFPDTVEEFMEQNKMVDEDHVYSNGVEYVPIFRMMQWFEHRPERKKGKWIWDDEGYHCSECWFHAHGNTLECMDGTYRFCPNCGADMRGEA